jgi:hypothetical protein
MRQIGLKTLSILLLTVTLASCNLDSLNDPIVVAEVNDEFHIDLWENLSPFGNSFIFNIQTIVEYECENYTIDFNMVPKFREVSISLNDIQEPADCEAGFNTAHAAISLGTLSAGFYELNVDLKNTVFNQGQLTVSKESYLIEMEDAKGIDFLRRELFRIPENTIWGYISYDNTAEAIADDFILQLEGITQAKALGKGYYGYFSIENDNSDQIILPHPPAAYGYKAFLLHFDGQDNEILDLVGQFRSDHGQAIQINLTNHQGRVF